MKIGRNGCLPLEISLKIQHCHMDMILNILNFLRLHYEENKISLSILNNLKVQDYRSWISF